jgi:hypothetical protein
MCTTYIQSTLFTSIANYSQAHILYKCLHFKHQFSCTSDITYMLERIQSHCLYVSSVTFILRICIMLCPPSPVTEDYSLSAVRKCLFHIFTATIWRSSSSSKTENTPCSYVMGFFLTWKWNNTSSTSIMIYGLIWSEKSLLWQFL